jgi:hypothetical protein
MADIVTVIVNPGLVRRMQAEADYMPSHYPSGRALLADRLRELGEVP